MFIFPYQIFFFIPKKHRFGAQFLFSFRLFPPQWIFHIFFFWRPRLFQLRDQALGICHKVRRNITWAPQQDRPTDPPPKNNATAKKCFTWQNVVSTCIRLNFEGRLGGRGWQLVSIHQEKVGLEIQLESASTKHTTNMDYWLSMTSMKERSLLAAFSSQSQ